MKSIRHIIAFLVTGGVLAAWPVAAMASPHFTLNPTSGSKTVGTNFTVTVGVDSGTERSEAVDVWMTFDATKLEIVSIDKASDPVYSFSLTPNIDNSAGKFNVGLASNETTSLGATTLNGNLIVVTFRPKATGTASLNFSCQSGSSIDTNIFNTTGTDVVDCAANQSGSYTISADSTTTTTTATTSNTPTPTPQQELPRTGNFGVTVTLIGLGMFGVLSALVLGLL